MKSIVLVFLLLGSVASAQEKQFVETRQKIVIIDTGISKAQAGAKSICRDSKGRPLAYSANPRFSPFSNHKHGINIANIIASKINVKKYCIVSIRGFADEVPNFYIRGIQMVSRLTNVVAVNMSIASQEELGENPYIMREHAAITKLLLTGVQINVAAGNLKRKFTEKSCNVFPACLANYYEHVDIRGFNVIESYNGNFSNESLSFPTYKREGVDLGNPKLSGTSQATALFTGQRYSE